MIKVGDLVKPLMWSSSRGMYIVQPGSGCWLLLEIKKNRRIKKYLCMQGSTKRVYSRLEKV